jgi:predicted dehydrogenase
MLDDTYGHTSHEKAIGRKDVYGIAPDPERQCRSLIRLGIIGVGGVAQSKYLPAITRLRTIWEPVKVTAVADPSVAQGQKVQELYGARWYTEYQSMLANEELDGLLVCGPDELHAEHTLAGIERGLPVLVEKPISRFLREAELMCRTAEEHRIPLMTVAMKRYSPPYRRAKEIVRSGAVANPALYIAKFNLGYEYVDLLESGTIHMFDISRFMMGDVGSVYAVAVSQYGRSRYPFDNAVISMVFHDRAVGSISTSCSALSFKPWERVEIYGDHAWLAIEDQNELVLYDDETGPAKSWKLVMTNTLLFDEEFMGYMGQVENFLQVIRRQETPLVTGRDGLKALELAAATHLSIARACPVKLPLDLGAADEELCSWLNEQIATAMDEK